MHNKRTWIDKLSDFISGKGFYLVVLICVAAIALSGYYLVQGVRGGLDSTLDQPVTGSAAIRDTPAPSARPSLKPSPSPAPSARVLRGSHPLPRARAAGGYMAGKGRGGKGLLGGSPGL